MIDGVPMLWLLVLLGLNVLLGVVVLVLLLVRPKSAGIDSAAAQALSQLAAWLGQQPAQRQADAATAERQQLSLRRDVHATAREGRAELAEAIGRFQQTLLAQTGDVARTQNEQIDTFRTQLAAMQQGVTQSLEQASERLAGQVRQLAEGNERRLEAVRETVETRLAALQSGNEARLEQMRATVDEKLQATLEERLGQSFRQVAERLEQVHQGLGEMRGLARDVGSLNRVLTNVKTRGIYGEVQLAALLEQVLTREQYATNVETVPGSGARVEFAIRLPGRGVAASGAMASASPGTAHDGAVWLPIDAKFPREDYERLLDAQERADAPAAELAARAIEQRLKLEARSIREKYLAAPHTTDFALLFLPTEGLYAEALRRPGLVEALQREHRVALTGPTTLLAVLSSLQMGFRTLALEQRSAEVWEVLGAVKTEFGKFGEVLARTRKKLDEASHSIDMAERRTRVMQRQLKGVEALPEPQAAERLGQGVDGLEGSDGDGGLGDAAAAPARQAHRAPVKATARATGADVARAADADTSGGTDANTGAGTDAGTSADRVIPR